jgi:hypothetical protein
MLNENKTMTKMIKTRAYPGIPLAFRKLVTPTRITKRAIRSNGLVPGRFNNGSRKKLVPVKGIKTRKTDKALKGFFAANRKSKIGKKMNSTEDDVLMNNIPSKAATRTVTSTFNDINRSNIQLHILIMLDPKEPCLLMAACKH